MTPREFPESNATLTGGPGRKVESAPVGNLPVWRSHGDEGVQVDQAPVIVSCWRPTWRERLSILVFGRVWLSIVSWRTHPPVSVRGRYTVFEESHDD